MEEKSQGQPEYLLKSKNATEHGALSADLPGNQSVWGRGDYMRQRSGFQFSLEWRKLNGFLCYRRQVFGGDPPQSVAVPAVEDAAAVPGDEVVDALFVPVDEFALGSMLEQLCEEQLVFAGVHAEALGGVGVDE